ncbi:uncharacterized protein LOC105162761 [Sesamum indicum]|uniref:Uncharacterized protein LOC105162761 n=1 Tax=Sesamum indicum TaxID=4182 RepID=A0A6I9T5K3_SESIN|nr:uncharacterized protein LOC105162761 [Sesamum indicum]
MCGKVGVPMYTVTRQLKALKPVFLQQRRNKGDLSLNVQLAKGFLESAQIIVSYDRQNELFLLLEHCCRLVYVKTAKLEQIILQQQAKMQWMKGEDQCSRVFFRKIAQRQSVGWRARNHVIDIRYLRPWARHVLTEKDTLNLLSPITAADVKQAVFDIDEDKVPGPDGFSSGFYKVAWPIVGKEVTKAILEFFAMGKLLKQINTTLWCLYPSPCQASFVPGRSIGDNILLAQELFTGYKQARLPPRCALKVDIRKAYDIVEWDFLLAMLQLFGFPVTFIRWIEECATSPSFSVGLNEKPHGFFEGARGLRQGDLLSPYLFVLVMEGLDRFATLSRLTLNVYKSHLILSKSAQGMRDQMLVMLGFQEGHLPLRCLGLPLLSSRLSINDCQPLLMKIDQRIAGWEGMGLSYTGRVQIIKSALMAFSIYWCSAFLLPKGVIREIEKRLRAFL